MNRLMSLEEEYTQEYIILRKSVTCSICLEIYRDPVCLPCQHGFCESCISMALKVREKCPICSSPTKRNKLKHSTYLDETLDLFKKLLSSIEQSFKARKQSLIQQRSLAIAPNLQTSDSSALPRVASNRETSFPSNNLLNITHHSSDYESDLDIEKPNTVIKVDSFDCESIQSANVTSSTLSREPHNKRNKSRASNLKEPTMVIEHVPGIGNNETVDGNQQKEPDMTTFLKLTTFEKGSLVTVLPRTWAGINKLGGVGKVESLRALNAQDEPVDIAAILEAQTHQGSNERAEWLASLRVYYKVKYVLDGHIDDDIPSAFVEKFEELSRERRRSSNARQFMPPAQEVPSTTSSPAMTTKVPFASKPMQSPAASTSVSSVLTAKRNNRISTNKAIAIATDKENGTDTTTPAAIREPIEFTTTNNVLKKRKVLTLSKKSPNVTIFIQVAAPTSELVKDSVEIANEATVSGHKRKRTLVLLTTCIDEEQSTITLINKQLQHKSLLSQACSSFDEIFQCFLACSPSEISAATHFSNSVTHVIVSVDKTSQIMKQRTMKYMQGLAHGVWIVSTQWVYESFLAGKLLDETPFEVKSNAKAVIPRAPMRARQAHLNKRIPGLFAGYVVVLFGLFPLPGPTRSDLHDIVSVLGAQRIFTQMRHFWEYFCTLRRKSFQLTQDKEEDDAGNEKINHNSKTEEEYPTIVIVRSKEVPTKARFDASGDDAEEERQWILDDFLSMNKASDEYFLEESSLHDDDSSAESLQRLEQARLLQYFKTFPQVSALWVMDSVTNYEIQPFSQYLHPQGTECATLDHKASSNINSAHANSAGKQKVKHSSVAVR